MLRFINLNNIKKIKKNFFLLKTLFVLKVIQKSLKFKFTGLLKVSIKTMPPSAKMAHFMNWLLRHIVTVPFIKTGKILKESKFILVSYLY